MACRGRVWYNGSLYNTYLPELFLPISSEQSLLSFFILLEGFIIGTEHIHIFIYLYLYISPYYRVMFHFSLSVSFLFGIRGTRQLHFILALIYITPKNMVYQNSIQPCLTF